MNPPSQTSWSFLQVLIALLAHGLDRSYLGHARGLATHDLAGGLAHFQKQFRGRQARPQTLDPDAQADSRIDLYSMLYLDMALKLSDGTEPVNDAGHANLSGCYNGLALPSSSVLVAMVEELRCIRHRLTLSLARGAVTAGHQHFDPDLVACLAAFTPGRREILADWEDGPSTKLRRIACSDTWVAIQLNPPQGTGYLAPLHIALCTLDSSALRSADGSEDFKVDLYPSLLTALNHFSSYVMVSEPEDAPSWWVTLDQAAIWAARCYAALVDESSSPTPLQGCHVARWDMPLPLPLAEAEGSPEPVRGGSHGAAFSLCLMQAIARAHFAKTVAADP